MGLYGLIYEPKLGYYKVNLEYLYRLTVYEQAYQLATNTPIDSNPACCILPKNQELP